VWTNLGFPLVTSPERPLLFQMPVPDLRRSIGTFLPPSLLGPPSSYDPLLKWERIRPRRFAGNGHPRVQGVLPIPLLFSPNLEIKGFR